MTVTRRDVTRSAVALVSWLVIAYESPEMVDAGGSQLVLLYAAVTVRGAGHSAPPATVFADRRLAAS